MQADGGSVRWCGGGPCVVLVAASVDTSVPGESDGHKQAYVILPHQLQIFNSMAVFCISVVSRDQYPGYLGHKKSLFYQTWLTVRHRTTGGMMAVIENEKCLGKSVPKRNFV
jgi:hypothetical protein